MSCSIRYIIIWQTGTQPERAYPVCTTIQCVGLINIDRRRGSTRGRIRADTSHGFIGQPRNIYLTMNSNVINIYFFLLFLLLDIFDIEQQQYSKD